MRGWIALLSLATVCANTTAPPAGWQSETLDYNINWPSGLSLGEAKFRATRGPTQLSADLTFDASLPGFPVVDHYRSLANLEFCTVESEKQFTHGKRRGDEKTQFDLEKRLGQRETKGGGKTQLSTGPCAKDALTYLQFVRRELAQGRLPAAQTVYFGAPYQVKLDYAGTKMLRIGESALDTDRLTATIQGPASRTTCQLYFSKDAARTLVLVEVPFALGTFSMELNR
jgi:hypothetical protein